MTEILGKEKPHTIFAYGTLKQGFPNHGLMLDLINKGDAELINTYSTDDPYPLVIGPHGIPYLINLPGLGNKVKGEIYTVTRKALAQLDEFEGVSSGYYERIPVKVKVKVKVKGDKERVEAYFGHRSFGEALWKMKGEVGLKEYGIEEAKEYVRKDDRPGGKNTILDIFR